MRTLRYNESIWVEVFLCGLVGPVTGVAYDDPDLSGYLAFSSDSWMDFGITFSADNWTEVGNGVYRLKLGPFNETGWSRDFCYWRVAYSGEPGFSIVDCGAVAKQTAIGHLTGYELAEIIADYLSGIIGVVDNWHSGYIREQIPHKLLPAVDVAVTDWASEDFAGYRRWTGGLTIRITAADSKRISAVELIGNLAADIATLLQEADIEGLPVDAIRDWRLEYGVEPNGQAVRAATLTAKLILEE